MTTIECEVGFDLIEMDLLATHAGVSFPFPLRVPSFGRLASERAALLAEAAHGLRARGLATGDGPAGIAAELVTGLREYRAAVDVVVTGVGIGAVAMVYGDLAVVCRQSLHGASTIRVSCVDAEVVSDELVALVPEVAAAQGMPITVPPGMVAGLPGLPGQAGVVRGGVRQREVSWLDSASGRRRVDLGGDGWASVNPLRHNELVRVFGELAAAARAW